MYAFISVVLVVSVFTIVWLKKDNALLAATIASLVIALTILASPYNDYIIAEFEYRLNGTWHTAVITAWTAKIVLTAGITVSVLAINGIFKKLGINDPYHSKGKYAKQERF
jgi:hypothetical protein